jgi:hypothetical protein
VVTASAKYDTTAAEVRLFESGPSFAIEEILVIRPLQILSKYRYCVHTTWEVELPLRLVDIKLMASKVYPWSYPIDIGYGDRRRQARAQ